MGIFGFLGILAIFGILGKMGIFGFLGILGRSAILAILGEKVKKWFFREMAILGEIAVVGKNGYFCENVVFGDFGRSLENGKLWKM